MTVFEGAVLGLVQGLTEFLPVSSSGHLVIIPYLLGWPLPSVSFGVILHLGTLGAVVSFFWNDLRLLPGPVRRRTIVLSLLATVPAAVVALLFRDFFQGLFEQPMGAGFFLIVTGLILFLSEQGSRGAKPFDRIGFGDAMIAGLAQVLALAPGISRSGATMAAGVMRGVDRHGAARFSFLMSIPIILAAALEEIASLSLDDVNAAMVTGFLVSAVSGYVCIKYLLEYLKKGNFMVFAVYCWVFGGFTLVLSYLRQ